MSCVSDQPLLLPSLRLFIPPLRLVSAAMWQVVQRGSVQDYGMVEEFISAVTEIVFLGAALCVTHHEGESCVAGGS
uniref:TERF1-interacting nuclear factor 2 N-terminal domain-containing protein n=1 Tax=Echeneis naucrates TaxID=173247 RepID=A0A665V328_ECHNA